MSSQKFYRTPFATSGDVADIPDAVQADGSVSYAEGFGGDYERDPTSDPDSKRIPRDQTNQYLYDITNNLRQYQLAGFPEWVTSTQNGGTAVSYAKNAYVRHNGSGAWVIYCATIDGAVLEPGVASGWAAEWSVLTPTDAASLAATAAQIWALSSGTVFVSPLGLKNAMAAQTLTDAATISWNMALGFRAKVTLAGNRTLGAPTGLVEGQTGSLQVIQDGTGSRTLAYASCWDWGATGTPVLSTTAGKRDIIRYEVIDAVTPILSCTIQKSA